MLSNVKFDSTPSMTLNGDHANSISVLSAESHRKSSVNKANNKANISSQMGPWKTKTVILEMSAPTPQSKQWIAFTGVKPTTYFAERSQSSTTGAKKDTSTLTSASVNQLPGVSSTSYRGNPVGVYPSWYSAIKFEHRSLTSDGFINNKMPKPKQRLKFAPLAACLRERKALNDPAVLSINKSLDSKDSESKIHSHPQGFISERLTNGYMFRCYQSDRHHEPTIGELALEDARSKNTQKSPTSTEKESFSKQIRRFYGVDRSQYTDRRLDSRPLLPNLPEGQMPSSLNSPTEGDNIPDLKLSTGDTNHGGTITREQSKRNYELRGLKFENLLDAMMSSRSNQSQASKLSVSSFPMMTVKAIELSKRDGYEIDELQRVFLNAKIIAEHQLPLVPPCSPELRDQNNNKSPVKTNSADCQGVVIKIPTSISDGEDVVEE